MRRVDAEREEIQIMKCPKCKEEYLEIHSISGCPNCEPTIKTSQNDIDDLIAAAKEVLAWIVPAPGEAAHIFAEFPQVGRLADALKKVKV